VAVINPADKLRFGEDSTPRVYANVKKAAEEAGLELKIAADGSGRRRLRRCGDPAKTWQWEVLTSS
jgi:hypothetical protein